MTQHAPNIAAPEVPSVEQLLQAIPEEYMERVAQLLERYPMLFRVLRVFNPEEIMLRPEQVPEDAGRFIVADVEGTGTDANADHICEVGMVEVAYCKMTGYLYGATRVFDELEDPGVPIPAEASAVNHITDDMVAGRHIDDEEVNAMVEKADFIVCHNASYDRPMLERRFPVFAGKAFACSLKQVPWAQAGVASAKQEFIAQVVMRFFYEAHRADSDCLALVKILNTPLPGLENDTPFQRLVEKYRNPELRIWAVEAPFEAKDSLYKRGYAWSDGKTPGTEKAWNRAVPAADFHAELAWLYENVYRKRQYGVAVDSVTEFNRFSSRRNKLGMAFCSASGLQNPQLLPPEVLAAMP